jgi:hypothetical protein
MKKLDKFYINWEFIGLIGLWRGLSINRLF